MSLECEEKLKRQIHCTVPFPIFLKVQRFIQVKTDLSSIDDARSGRLRAAMLLHKVGSKACFEVSYIAVQPATCRIVPGSIRYLNASQNVRVIVHSVPKIHLNPWPTKVSESECGDSGHALNVSCTKVCLVDLLSVSYAAYYILCK